MSVTVHVRLSEVGQKAQLLAGKDASREQTFMVEYGEPEFAAAVQVAKMDGGKAVLKRHWHDCPEWDHLPAIAEVLAEMTAGAEKAEAEKRRELEERHAATLAVLVAKKTTTTTMTAADNSTHSYRTALWPYGADQEIISSPEAVTWEAELAAEKSAAEKARAEATAAHEERIRERLHAHAAAEEARRAELGLAADELDLKVEDGALTKVPRGCWESHSRGKNWLAVISVDPSSPGGLSRTFMEKAKGEFYYHVAALAVGDAIEFGADYYSGRGRKNAKRWYGVVTRRTDDMLVVRECNTGKAACGEAAKVVAAKPAVEDEIAAGIKRINAEGVIVPSPSNN